MTHQLEWIVFASYHLFRSSQMSCTVSLSSWEYYHPGQRSRMIGAAINPILASLVHDLSWWAVTDHQWAQLRDKLLQCWNLSWLYYTDYISIVVNHVKTAALVSPAVCILCFHAHLIPHSAHMQLHTWKHWMVCTHTSIHVWTMGIYLSMFLCTALQWWCGFHLSW